MTFRDLFRTPLGIVVAAWAIVVTGMATAAYLLNVPVLLVLGGALLAAALGFWLVTRKEPAGSSPGEQVLPPKP